MAPKVEISERLLRWQRAWQGNDPQAVAALYTPDARHTSSGIARYLPERGTKTLSGPAALHDYASRVFATNGRIRFEILSVIEQGPRAVVEYIRHSDRDDRPPLHVCELLEWQGDRLAEVRVFHV